MDPQLVQPPLGRRADLGQRARERVVVIWDVRLNPVARGEQLHEGVDVAAVPIIHWHVDSSVTGRGGNKRLRAAMEALGITGGSALVCENRRG